MFIILATTVWFEVLAGFHFCYMYFCNFENRKILRIPLAREPGGSQINYGLYGSVFDKLQVYLLFKGAIYVNFKEIG